MGCTPFSVEEAKLYNAEINPVHSLYRNVVLSELCSTEQLSCIRKLCQDLSGWTHTPLVYIQLNDRCTLFCDQLRK